MNTDFLSLPLADNHIHVTYVWIDGTGEDLRAKTRSIDFIPSKPSELPIWNFDGSSSGQAEGRHSEVFLHPVALFKDPFRRGNHKLVLCETFERNGFPHESNLRNSCNEVMKRVEEHHPWFGIEQEYSILEKDGRPLGWPKDGFPAPQGPYYCGTGANKVCGRAIEMDHYFACDYAGIKFAGTNAEVMLSQWEFQVGPCEGIDVSDHLWMARYILHRIAEIHGVIITFDPKPVLGNWNGAGAHTNYSTVEMRAANGITYIEEAVEKLSRKHMEHIQAYDPHKGEDNKRRLIGRLETSSIDKFSSGVGNRGASVRIPFQVAENRCGYLEDRRPSSNCDPYSVTQIIVETTLLDH